MKYKRIINSVLIILFIFVINVEVVYAKNKDIEISNIKIIEASESAHENTKAEVNDYTINTDITFNNPDDYIKYKLTIKNNTNHDYIIDSITSDHDSKKIMYNFELSVEKVKAHKTADINMILVYKDSDNKEYLYKDTVNLELSVINKDGKVITIPSNKRNNIILIIIISTLLILISSFIIYKFVLKKRTKNK